MTEPAEHEPIPVAEISFVSLCAICFEKIRRTRGDHWEHFGMDTPWEKMEL